MTDLFAPLTFAHGPAMKNRFALAPLTNQQSHPDGRLSDAEFRWLTMRAVGGFALVMTCAAHVQKQGQGFPGQLGIFSDDHLEGLSRLAAEVKRQGSVAVVQLIHGGMRADKSLIDGPPVCPSDNAEFGARAMTEAEVEQVIEDFIAAARRAERAGFDGVELHGAHGYLLAQFLSPEINQRTDRYGGSLENRTRIVNEIIAGIRARCGPDFSLGLRLSPERFHQRFEDILSFAGQLMRAEAVDYLDMSLWDVFKAPQDEAFSHRTLLSWFAGLERGKVRLGVAGKVMTPSDAAYCLENGADFVLLGRAAILHHDYPARAREAGFRPAQLPVSRQYLESEGLSPAFVEYMNNWKGFVAAE